MTLRNIAVSLVAILLAFSPSSCVLAGQPLKLLLVGDSTVCNYPAQRPDRGWGQYLEEHFQPGSVTVINHAASGRSTKTFIKQGRWQKALAEKPDYVFIQFGHNDSHAPENPESTSAAGDFRDYLRQYIDDARAAGATPILITPMVRRKFDPEGRLQDNLAPYADAIKAVAREKNCALIDLHTSSRSLVEELGPSRARTFANKPNDFTHFNETGARAMAALIVRDLPTAEPKLGKLLVKP
jgi:lysophospholipase L1-like esterase